MSSSQSETTPEETGAEKVSAPEKKTFGCFKLLLLTGLLVLTSIMVTLFAIDKMNAGGKVKRKIQGLASQLIDMQAAPVKVQPPPKPVIKIVEKIVKVPVEKIVVKEKIVEVEVNSPLPSKYISWKKIDTAKMWNGIQVANSVAADQGESASVERVNDEAFQIEMKVSFKVPTPGKTAAELDTVNPHFSKSLPGVSALVGSAVVSPFYHKLYENKTERIQQKATRFDQLLSVHNLYDTETVLEIENPETNQIALLIQSDMDVVSDGSDGDRWPFPENYVSMSKYYQPFTSYGWGKKTRTPNPLLERWEAEYKKHKERFAVKGLSIEENRFLRSRLDVLPAEIADMKARSYLIAEADPFIVMSLAFLGRTEETKFGPMIGDYAVVLHEDKLYPTIIGDAGPSFKFGEASLRLARQINPKASPYSRPVSDLSVTYLVFPGSREKVNSPPDLATWHEKCSGFLQKLGGIGEGYELHQWEDIIPKKLEEWKAKHPDAVITSTPVVPEPIDPATLPQPSFSDAVTAKTPAKPAKEADKKAEESQ